MKPAVVHIKTHTARNYTHQLDEWFALAAYYLYEKEDAPDASFSLKLVKLEKSKKLMIL